MHRRRRDCALLWATVLLLWSLSASVLASAEPLTGTVVGIADGDTLTVLSGGTAMKVRLYGIDAPEKAQAYGTKAKQLTSRLAFRRTVTVTVHSLDRYGRRVGEVMLPDGRNLGQELVRRGVAWWYQAYAPDNTTLAQLEAEARAAKRGLWAGARTIPPWQWRKDCQ